MTLVREYQPTFVLGDGETKEFSYLFEEVSENFVKVIVKHSDNSTYVPVFSVDLDSHKVVFGESETAPLDTDLVCIYRETPDLQDTPFRTLQGYDAKALENILSKIVAMIQELKANGFSTQILQGASWQLDLLQPADDGASVVIDYNARILKKGLYFQLVGGNLQVSADGNNFIKMPKSADITEFRRLETVLEDLTVIYRLQYKVDGVWYNTESNAEATADEALQVAQVAKELAEDTAETVGTFDTRITQAEQNASDAKSIAQTTSGNLTTHTSDMNNPHQVTKAQVGLGNVDNTSDLNKPISTATQAALDTKANTTDIPTVGNGTITITQGGTTKGTFTTNQGGNTTIDLDSGGAGHNVGDIFFTMRNDNELNGAVECDGSTYNTTDFIGAQSIGALLAAGKVPYVSLADYATALATNGSVGVFGWDGTNTTAFRVPLLNDIFVETGTAAQIGDCLKPGLPNLSGSVNVGMFGDPSGTGVFTGASASYNWPLRGAYTAGYGGNVPFNASNGNSIYGNSTTVQPNAVRYRAMVQLVTATTDEAVATCTSVLADVAALKYDYVVDFQAPTATNGYTWYRKYKSGWVEQGGETTGGANSVTLPIEMADDHYTVIRTQIGSSQQSYFPAWVAGFDTRTTTGFTFQSVTQNNIWQVSGMARG